MTEADRGPDDGVRLVTIPPIDRAGIIAMVADRKSNLLAALPTHQKSVLGLIELFFRGLAPIAERWFGQSPALLLGVCTVRRNQPGSTDFHPVHCDASFFPYTGVGLTFWCPFDQTGETSPGLVVSGPQGDYVPCIGPGQALVIPPTVMHRTQRIEGERASLEFRCAPSRKLPVNLGESRIAVQAEIDGRRRILVAPVTQLVRDGLCELSQDPRQAPTP